ncbi:MAG: STAS/SEC14 domain-containing protein [Gammaproteobacteria bacterium]|jgi:hypothetical protein|nr:STAS/SEC14 domain-containing protein [Gammaproteobacteria bacterium]
MIEKIESLPENALGFVATGTVTANDYETVLIPAVEAAFSRTDKVRLLYHLGPEFSGFETAAMWDDAKIGLKHIRGWERIAVVSDVEWVRVGVNVFSLAIPGEIRVFHNRELSDATRWIAE